MVHFEGHFKGTYGLRAKEDLKMRRGRSMKISSQSIFDSVQPVLRGETAGSQALKTSASEPVELKLQLLHDDAFSSDGGIATVKGGKVVWRGLQS